MINRLQTNRPHAARAAFVIAGALAALVAASPAEAQRRQPVVATAAPAHPAAPVQVVPYPGATVTLDSRVYGRQLHPSHRLHSPGLLPRYPQVSAGYYVPGPIGYGYYPP